MNYSIIKDKYLWAILIIAIVVRLYSGFTTFVISTDAVQYIDQARNFVEGRFNRIDYSDTVGFESSYHPLYSFLIAVLFQCINNYEISAKVVSIIMGVSLVTAVYVIGKRIFDSRIAFFCALILCFHPYASRLSAEILSESTYLFFFTLAIGLGFFALNNYKPLYFVGTGLSSAFAYLTRPEGVGVLMIVGFFTVFWKLSSLRVSLSRRLWCLVIMLLAFSFMASPYLIYIKKQTGHWALTKKKSVTELLGFENISFKQNVGSKAVEGNSESTSDHGTVKKSERGVSNYKTVLAKPLGKIWNLGYRKYLDILMFMISKFISTYHPLLILLLIFGIITYKRIPRLGKPGIYLGLILAFYMFILFALAVVFSSGEHYYLSRRHLMPLVIPTMFCSAIGIQTLSNWVGKRSVSPSTRYRWFLDAKVIIPIIVICVLLPKTLKFHRAEKIGTKEAGYWLSENAQEDTSVIMGISPRMAFYAGGKHVFMSPGSYGEMIVHARSLRVNYLEIYKEKIARTCPDFFESINDEDIELVYQHKYEGKSKELNLLLYKVLYGNE